MKHKLAIWTLLLALLLSSCGQSQQQNTPDDVQQTTEQTEFSFEGTTFHYGEHDYDLTLRSPSITSILSAVLVGDKIVIEGHCGPKNGVYCIFDTVSESFETDLWGHHLIWHSDDITTAIYAFWSDIYTYDGSIIKKYDLAENEFIYNLEYTENYTKLKVTIVCDDDTQQIDTLDLTDRDVLIASLYLDTLEPYQPWLSLEEPDTVLANTMGDILCEKALPDGTEIVCYWQPDTEFTKYWAVRQGDSLLRFCKEESGYTYDYTVSSFENILGHDGFRIECPRGASYNARDYYYIDENGVPRLLAECANNVMKMDLDGDGDNELLCEYHYPGGTEITVYLRRDGIVYQVDICDLIRSVWPEAGNIEVLYSNQLAIEVPIPGSMVTATAFRTLLFDGENLRLYKDETPYEDHVKVGVKAPADVLAAARDFVQGELNAMIEGATDDLGSVIWDDWRITSLNGPYYETAGELTVEIWNLGYETHTATPERMMLAGGSYRGEDGWCMDGYPGCDYLYFALDGDGNRTFLYTQMENDCAPGAELFHEDMLRDLEAGGFLTPPQESAREGWQTLSTDAEAFDLSISPESPNFVYVFNHADTVPLDQLVAFLLVSDGAYTEGAVYELRVRFLEAPDTVLMYLALLGDQITEYNGQETPTAELICDFIASADAAWYDGSEEFAATMEQCRKTYPEGPIAELLDIMEEKYAASMERHHPNL